MIKNFFNSYVTDEASSKTENYTAEMTRINPTCSTHVYVRRIQFTLIIMH